MIACCCCVPVRCGFITLAIFELLSLIGNFSTTISIYGAGSFDVIPFFSIAILLCVFAQTYMVYEMARWVLSDTKETRFGYLRAIHVGIGTTIAFWLFLMIFVQKVVTLFKGAATSVSNDI